jgi:hypothetical protein
VVSTNGCFAGNIIPVGRLSPAGIAILNSWPVPNLANFIGGNGNWFAAALHTQDQRKDTLALDYNLTSKQRLTFRRQNYAYSSVNRSMAAPTGRPSSSTVLTRPTP